MDGKKGGQALLRIELVVVAVEGDIARYGTSSGTGDGRMSVRCVIRRLCITNLVFSYDMLTRR